MDSIHTAAVRHAAYLETMRGVVAEATRRSIVRGLMREAAKVILADLRRQGTETTPARAEASARFLESEFGRAWMDVTAGRIAEAALVGLKAKGAEDLLRADVEAWNREARDAMVEVLLRLPGQVWRSLRSADTHAQTT
jgi:hypothetical protein